MQKTINGKFIWIELLRIFACFCVILLHVSAIGWRNAELGTRSWYIFEFFNSFSRIGVCTFVMISGMLFLGNIRGNSIALIYKKNVRKILICLLAWSIFYFIFRYVVGSISISSFGSVVKGLIYGNYHFWYLWMLIGLYIITPILNGFVRKQILCEYLLCLCVLFCWLPGSLEICPTISNFINKFICEKLYVFLPMGYVGFYIAGYYLNTFSLKVSSRKLLILFGFIGLVCAVVGGAVYSMYIGKPSQLAYNNLTLQTALYSISFMYIFREKIREVIFSDKVTKIILKIGESTFGIFLIHVMFVESFSNAIFDKLNYSFAIICIPISMLIFALGFICTRLIKLIPCVGKWVV